MTPEEIQALIDNSLSTFRTEITQQFTQAHQGLAASLTKEMKKVLSQVQAPEETEQPSAEGSAEPILTLKALQQQIQDLTQQLADKDKKAFEAERDTAILNAIASSDTTNKTALRKLFGLQYADAMKKEGDKWFIDLDGNVASVEDALANYLKSEEGESFIPPSGVKGSGTKETKPVISLATKDVSLDDQWSQVTAFLSNQ